MRVLRNMDKNTRNSNDLREMVECVISESPLAIQSLNENGENVRLVLSYENEECADDLELMLDIIKKIRDIVRDQTISVPVKGVMKRLEDQGNIIFSIDPNGPIEIE